MTSDTQRRHTPLLHKILIVLIVLVVVLIVLAYLSMQTLEGGS